MSEEQQKLTDVFIAAKRASDAWESENLSPEHTERIMQLMFELHETLVDCDIGERS